jgi:hypothetical protein
VFSHSISLTLTHAKSQTIQSGPRPVAGLPCAYCSMVCADPLYRSAVFRFSQ